ncbi:MAG: signal peptidase I [Planctomycetes bacterium]|nr:signal peptidase I [Planctomycetota bacterium]
MEKPENKDPDPSLERKRSQVKLFKRWMRRARVLFALVVVVMGVYFMVSYGVYTLPGEYRAGSNKIQSPVDEVMPGDTVILLSLNLWREPKLGDIVIYDHPDPKDGVPSQLIGRIAGLPGETVHAVLPTFRVQDRQPLNVGFVVGPDAALKDGDVIPAGEYLVVADTDAVAYADSRDFGYVKRAAIKKKVIFNLAYMIGQRSAPEPDSPANEE